ncbi:tail fiber domain-containing protein [Chryseobacterium populi]|uniref:Por secretion system C-terminal sorting domain containing protein n=1 Tax=Chryseobacterium populi TaxID=1144316 RepID=J2STY1_9FLAO|nr:tail fiber domain-containing protein [Chryseobacterium populi]EJL69027.1 Por secretion system C-terminal sorting domain containing protein [Chryseobacterium populi]
MKKITTSLCLLLFGVTFSVSAQNVWTGTTTPTTTTGSVGIGNTAPTTRLDINSGPGISALKINHGYTMFSGTNVANIIEVYNRVTNIIPPVDPVLINWLSTGGVFGLRTLSNSLNENRIVYNDNLGNVKSSGIVLYSSPSFGNGTVMNSIQGVAYLNFLNGGNGSATGGVTVLGNGNNELYVSGRFQAALEARAQSFISTSDRRLKDNIRPLKGLSPNLLNIESYSYTFKKKEGENRTEDKLHFGFIAQEVEKQFPNLVSIDEKGNYALNYVEFIPLLLNELKEQKSEINDLKSKMEALEEKINALSGNKVSNPENQTVSSTVFLEQNAPNPFNRETVIKFNAGEGNASIGIYDLSGRQMQMIPVKKGETQISVSARTLSPGTYLYNLVVNGKPVASKKMIVTN